MERRHLEEQTRMSGGVEIVIDVSTGFSDMAVRAGFATRPEILRVAKSELGFFFNRFIDPVAANMRPEPF